MYIFALYMIKYTSGIDLKIFFYGLSSQELLKLHLRKIKVCMKSDQWYYIDLRNNIKTRR